MMGRPPIRWLLTEEDDDEGGGKWMSWAMNSAAVMVQKLSSRT